MDKPHECLYPVIEFFHSIQGEGYHSGTPATFIRFAGCNLRCPWCDTKKSWDRQDVDVSPMTEFEIAANVSRETPRLVVITGGEPTLYDLGPLARELHKMEKYVAIETNGTRSVPSSWKLDWVAASPKPPLYQLNCFPNELKYVVDDDFKIGNVHMNVVMTGRTFLQVEGNRPESLKRAIEMCRKNDLRLGVQLHKLIGVL